jgi:hypothetical protein
MDMRKMFLAALLAAALPAAAGDRIPIVDEGGIAGQWTAVPGTQLIPPYPPAYAGNPDEVCLVVGYLVNADGTTSDFSLLKSWASGGNRRDRDGFWKEFGDLASRALAQWRYAPRDAASAEPVYTAATFVFGRPDAVTATKAHCEVSDLAIRMLELRYNPRAARMMSGGIYDRLDIDPAVEERYAQETYLAREYRARVWERLGVRHERQAAAAMAANNDNQSTNK